MSFRQGTVYLTYVKQTGKEDSLSYFQNPVFFTETQWAARKQYRNQEKVHLSVAYTDECF